jgi:superfamily II DNA or RNA helicase
MSAVGGIAPYRLGLTATPERADAGESMLPELIGPIVYRREITQMAGDILASYRAERRYVELSPDEKERYQKAREHYRRFIDEHRISMGSPHGWQQFLRETCRSSEGRAAF